MDLDSDPPWPALEVPLLSPEPRHAVGGDETAGLTTLAAHGDGATALSRDSRSMVAPWRSAAAGALTRPCP